jgi:hypothetical protein
LSERFDAFAVEELQTITCRCPKCGNLITFSMLTDEKYGLPKGCPTCNELLEALTAALKEYRQFYRTATHSGLPIRIHAWVFAGVQGRAGTK